MLCLINGFRRLSVDFESQGLGLFKREQPTRDFLDSGEPLLVTTGAVAPISTAIFTPPMGTVYRIVQGSQQFGIHSYFRQFCFGNCENMEIAKSSVEVL